jgi:chromosome partitioning protein
MAAPAGARRIAFINEKGGTCKTTLAVHTAAWLASNARGRVLLVDLDTQGHAGKSLGIDVRSLDHTIADLMVDPSMDPDEAILETGIAGLDLLPANKQAADLPERLAAHADRHRRLRQVIDRVDAEGTYAYVVFDSPPSLGLTTLNVMVAAQEVVVPVALTYFALDGCAEIVSTVERTREEHGHPDLEVTLVVPTFHRNTRLAEEVLGKLRDYFGDKVTPVLGYNVKIDEAQSHGQTIWEYAPWSRGAQMLEAVAQAVKATPRKRAPVRRGA